MNYSLQECVTKLQSRPLNQDKIVILISVADYSLDGPEKIGTHGESN